MKAMKEPAKIDIRSATQEERAKLLDFMRDDLVADVGLIMDFLGLTWPEFEQLYASRGEVRTVLSAGEPAGYCWIEHRGRELHLHAIFVLPEMRSRGIGRAILRSLEQEFRGEADVFELGVRVSNDGARALYEREGFTIAQSLEEISFLVMRKSLN